MPHGYTCDRCETFVEQGDFGSELYDGQAIERVSVRPPIDDGEDFEQNDYTLCDDCRKALVKWVDKGTPNLFGTALETADFSWSIGVEQYKPHSELMDVSGVGEEKAKALYGAGYKTRSDLQKASQSELSDVDTIGNALAARIKADVGGFKSAEEVVEYIEDLLEEYSD
jgi:hypothetical protein